ncbi:mitochondrial ribosomal protein S18C [Xylocopa sonorina]|uniref:mitochondrial ribosomal protein S18C n=1 Tax=Xylocopa sonorina TaxID=1818115 RepID=UPI00403AFBC7
MISTFINPLILKNTRTSNISAFLFRSKTNEACAPNEVTDSENSDMPINIENPFKKERKLCILCKLNINPDYKNVRLLSQFQSRHTGRIYGKHITGLCEHKHNKVVQEIKKAQVAGLMGYMTKDPQFVNDPQLFNPDFPFRPHKY